MPTILSIAFGLASLLIFRKNSGVFPRLARAWLRGLFKFEYDLLIKLPTSLDNIKSDCAKTPTQCVFQSAQKRKNKRHPSAYVSKPSQRAVFSLVLVVGVEPTRCCQLGILSPVRLPFRHTSKRYYSSTKF